MNLQIEDKGAAVLLLVEEERLDSHNTGDLKNQMLKLFEEGKHNLVVDLQAVRFVDSSGLGALVSGFKNASSRNGNLKLAGLQLQVRLTQLLAAPATLLAHRLKGPHPALVASTPGLDTLANPLLLLGQFFVKQLVCPLLALRILIRRDYPVDRIAD